MQASLAWLAARRGAGCGIYCGLPWLEKNKYNVINIRSFSEENEGNHIIEGGLEALEQLELSDEYDSDDEGDDPNHVDSKYQFYKVDAPPFYLQGTFDDEDWGVDIRLPLPADFTVTVPR